MHNHPQSPTTIHNYPQPPKKLPTTTHNYPQPPKKPPTTARNHLESSTTNLIHPKNHPQSPKATQKLPKKAKTCHNQLCYCTLDVTTETDVVFDNVSVCIYLIIHYIYYFLVKSIVCFCHH